MDPRVLFASPTTRNMVSRREGGVLRTKDNVVSVRSMYNAFGVFHMTWCSVSPIATLAVCGQMRHLLSYNSGRTRTRFIDGEACFHECKLFALMAAAQPHP